MRTETLNKFLNKPITIFVKIKGKELIFNGQIIYIDGESGDFEFIDRYGCVYVWPCEDVNSIRIRELEIIEEVK